MGEPENQERGADYYSKSVRAGKRTYFFDVKATRAKELFVTITESKRRFNEADGRFTYEKHKIFLYGEDFEKFREGLDAAINFVENDQDTIREDTSSEAIKTSALDVSFEDLGGEDEN
ncbi:MAG: DNA-binding protein [Bacteroidetes bacterium CG18_big_fil_WC_8_21_14_2_50_41_14]|nr:MAG: DNA-binding protein [Bacteroidetes bacterium CG18_big_fil_WC_8_21_14_2_50_41_14]PJB59361.1 MAG: DNA-binding protein [Bacteroidetes bacterium CG_4_9_14_3_um_filter_41_19]